MIFWLFVAVVQAATVVVRPLDDFMSVEVEIQHRRRLAVTPVSLSLSRAQVRAIESEDGVARCADVLRVDAEFNEVFAAILEYQIDLMIRQPLGWQGDLDDLNRQCILATYTEEISHHLVEEEPSSLPVIWARALFRYLASLLRRGDDECPTCDAPFHPALGIRG